MNFDRFGEDTEILHPFNQAFTSANGAMVLQRMTFTQTRTNFVKVMWLEAIQAWYLAYFWLMIIKI